MLEARKDGGTDDQLRTIMDNPRKKGHEKKGALQRGKLRNGRKDGKRGVHSPGGFGQDMHPPRLPDFRGDRTQTRPRIKEPGGSTLRAFLFYAASGKEITIQEPETAIQRFALR